MLQVSRCAFPGASRPLNLMIVIRHEHEEIRVLRSEECRKPRKLRLCPVKCSVLISPCVCRRSGIAEENSAVTGGWSELDYYSIKRVRCPMAGIVVRDRRKRRDYGVGRSDVSARS